MPDNLTGNPANSATGSQSASQLDAPSNLQARQSVRARESFQDQLSEEYTIDTPENVSFGYEVSGIGSRFMSTLIDGTILGILLIGLNIVVLVAIGFFVGDPSVVDEGLNEVTDWIAGMIIAVYALLNFAIWWGYYMLFEWLWNGQTFGKRVIKIRVVRADGAPLGFVPVAVRNLVRIIDFLPVAYGVGVITMFCNRKSRRLGDFAAGTLVVKDQGELTLDSLTSTLPKTPPTKLRTELPTAPTPATTSALPSNLSPDQDWSGIRRLSPADYELVQESLARYRANTLDSTLLKRVATVIATKLGELPSSTLDSVNLTTTKDQVDFLEAVAAAYGRWVK